MLKKRSNVNSQMAREDYDDLDDVSTEAGKWERAPEEELKQRKIVKIKNKSSSDNNNSSGNNNPFSGLGTSFMNVASNAASALNPFKNFNGLSSSTSSSTTASTSHVSNNTNNIMQSNVQTKLSNDLNKPKFSNTVDNNNYNNSSINNNNNNNNNNELEYKKKMTRLNQSLLTWMDQQLSENPISIWKDSLKGYIQYAKSTSEKYNYKEKIDVITQPVVSSKSAP
jgi:hypothetical protein